MRNALFCVKVSFYLHGELRQKSFGTLFESVKSLEDMRIASDDVAEVVMVYADLQGEVFDLDTFGKLLRGAYFYKNYIN